MEQSVDNFFLKIPEPEQSALLYLRHFFIKDCQLQENWKFNTPFYYYKGKWFCYISFSAKRNNEIYIGFVKGYKIDMPNLISEGRKQIKVYRINAQNDINIQEIQKIVNSLKGFY